MGIVADLSLILIFGLLFAAIAHRLGQPLLLGPIAAGVLLGPHTGLISIQEPHEVELLAEVGIALLLFAIGIEFSLRSLRPVARVALLGTVLQMSVTWFGGHRLALALGFTPVEALWVGAVVSVSSTMVVLRVLTSSGVMGTLSSRVMLGMLIVQDLAVLPMMILLPQLSGARNDPAAVALASGRSILLLVSLLVATRWIVPWIVHRVVGWGSRELFTLTVAALGLGIGYIAHLLGLSYALGAFAAGIALSESEYGHQALSDVLPLRDLFGLIFFASVGILFDPFSLTQYWREIALLLVAVMAGKGLLFALIVRLFGYRHVVPVAVGLSMGQIGEFSFLILQLGTREGAVGDRLHSILVSTTILSMLLTPYTARVVAPLHRWWRRRRPMPVAEVQASEEIIGHPVLVAGAGRVGSWVAEIFELYEIDFVVVDLDPHRIERARERGWKTVFGDATREPVLHAARAEHAPLVVVALPSAVCAREIARRIRGFGSRATLICRTDTVEEIHDLRAVPDVQIVHPELEAAREMGRLALRALGREADALSVDFEDLRESEVRDLVVDEGER